MTEYERLDMLIDSVTRQVEGGNGRQSQGEGAETWQILADSIRK